MTKNRPSQFKADQMAFGMLLAMGARSYSAILLKDNAIVGISQNSTSTERALQIVLADAKMREDVVKGLGGGNEATSDIGKL